MLSVMTRSAFRKRFLSRLPAAAASVFDQKHTFSLLRAVTSKRSAFKVYLCDGTPMFFECDKGDEDVTLFPSVFFTWIAPSCYPIICVHSSLLETLRGGADLMAPGIATSPEFEANSPVTVALLPASVELRKVDGPAFIGKSLLSLHEILSSGRRGRAVQIFHGVHDALWELGDRTIPMPKITLPIVADFERESQPESNKAKSEEAAADALTRLELDDSAANGGEESQEKTSSMEDTESVLRDTFFSAIRWKIKNNKEVAFPIDAGQFYANYVLKCLPSSDQKLELKRTRYKKFSTFLKLINEEEGAGDWVVKVNSRKGLDSIEDINFLHPRVIDAKPLSTEDESMRDAMHVPTEVVECYSVTDASLSFLSHCNVTSPVRRSDLIHLDGVRAAIDSYVREKTLLRSGKRVELDDQLQMLMKNFAPGTTVDLNTVVQKLVSTMTPAWSVKLADGRQKIYRGKIPCIEFKVEKRAGNKQVTLVNNLEVYGIDAKELCHHVHSTGSTTTPNAPNCFGTQVLLQGNQVNPISKLIQTTYGISTKYLKGLELGVKEEKRKKK